MLKVKSKNVTINQYRPFSILLKKKPKANKRDPNIHPPEEVWDYFRKYEVIKVTIDRDNIFLLLSNDMLLKPEDYFNHLSSKINLLRKGNNNILVGNKRGKIISMQIDFSGESHITYDRIPIYGPNDKELEENLTKELNKISDYHYSWNNMSEHVRLGFIKIPLDLRHTDININSTNVVVDQKTKVWTGSRKDFSLHIIELYAIDQKRPLTERLYSDIKDACKKIYIQYQFPDSWKWSPEKCYRNVLKVK